MSNREASSLLGIALAILEDVRAFYPEDTECVDRDKTRLSHFVQTRGTNVFLLDFPAVSKALEKCLDAERLKLDGLVFCTPRWPGSQIPRFLSGLWLRVFDKSGSLREDADVNAIAFLRQIFLFAKGFKRDCTQSRWRSAIEDFYACESEIRQPTLLWEADDLDVDGIRDIHIRDALNNQALHDGSRCPLEEFSDDTRRFGFIQTCFDYVVAGWDSFDPYAFPPRHGPGAVSDLPGGVSKYSFPSWPEKLDRVFPIADFAVSDWSYFDHLTSDDVERPSALLGVPKTAKGPRLIASEPTSHQWCQQIVAGYLSHVLRRTPLGLAINLRNQSLSRDAVLRASQQQDMATIDLSAASDRISCWLVERFFRQRADLVKVFHAVRTRSIVNRTQIRDIRQDRTYLRKFSTMGSALTFPIQSIIFATITAATLLYEEGRDAGEIRRPDVWGRLRVFGDDIICPRHVFLSVQRSLTALGLRVNADKSFGNGKFLESCGMDAFSGVCVTPARVNQIADSASPESIRSTVDASNNFFMKGLWRTAEYLISTLPPWVRKYLDVVSVDSGLVGLSSFCGPKTTVISTRWNRRLQRAERRTLVDKASVHRSDQPGEHSLFQRFVENPVRTQVWEAGRVTSTAVYLSLRWAPLESRSNDWLP